MHLAVRYSFILTCYNILPPLKPLEVRENGKTSNHKVCVLGLWAADEADGKRLVELADALESGRWVR